VITCTHCGTALSATTNFCTTCGTPVLASSATSPLADDEWWNPEAVRQSAPPPTPHIPQMPPLSPPAGVPEVQPVGAPPPPPPDQTTARPKRRMIAAISAIVALGGGAVAVTALTGSDSSSGVVVPFAPRADIERRWAVDVDAPYVVSAIATAETVFVAVGDGSDLGSLLAFDRSSGDERWSTELDSPCDELALVDGDPACRTSDARIVVFAAADGDEVWDDRLPDGAYFHQSGVIAADDGAAVVVPGDQRVRSLDGRFMAANGSRVITRDGDELLTFDAVDGDEIGEPIELDEDLDFVGLGNGFVIGMDSSGELIGSDLSGDELWSEDLSGFARWSFDPASNSLLTIEDDEVRLWRASRSAVEEQWSDRMSNLVESIGFVERRPVVVTQGDDPETREMFVGVDDGLESTETVDAGFAFLGDDQLIAWTSRIVAGVNPVTGEELWSARIDDARAALAGDAVVVYETDGDKMSIALWD
jgi:outer membrane protein assembly factor BamB